MTGVNNENILAELVADEEDLDLEFKDPYAFHMRNEPRWNKSTPEVDPETGWRFTYRDIGMTRNAQEKDKKEHKVFLDPLPHVVLDQDIPLRGWYKNKHEAEGKRPRPCYTDALLSQPYGGFCHVGCGFCYINNGTRGYRGQGVTTVDPRYAEKTGQQLGKMKTGQAVYMSSFIDPFLELEEHYHNTENLARAVTAVNLPIFFLTRKRVPGWAYDLLKLNPHSYMQFSINTSDPEKWKRLSPRALPLEELLEQVREMSRQGIYVSIQVNPIVPGIVDNWDIRNLIHVLAQAGADHLIFKFVEIVYPSVRGLVTQMYKRFDKERGAAFEQLFTQNIGGVRTVDEDYRKAAHQEFSEECRKAGVTMSLCYEYEYERDAEGNVKNKTGVSMGHKFLTADQCHGHRVPVYYRESTGEPFKPFEPCPPTGCLTCGDTPEGEAAVPCGSELLGSAPAWTPAMLKMDLVTPDRSRKRMAPVTR